MPRGRCTRHGRRSGVLALVFHPPLAFLRNYILRRGILDGAVGLIISIMNSYYVFLKFAKLWELQRPVGHHEDTMNTKSTKNTNNVYELRVLRTLRVFVISTR